EPGAERRGAVMSSSVMVGWRVMRSCLRRWRGGWGLGACGLGGGLGGPVELAGLAPFGDALIAWGVAEDRGRGGGCGAGAGGAGGLHRVVVEPAQRVRGVDIGAGVPLVERGPDQFRVGAVAQ